MNIKKADVLGFCFGVRRAVEMAEDALLSYSTKKVYSLGPLIHNDFVLSKLKSKNLNIVDENEISSIEDDSVVIIRAHGVSPKIINQLEIKKCTIIDATCPRVKASQKMVEKFSKNNDCVILTGDRNHGEVIGIAGYGGSDFYQIQTLDEAKNLKIDNLNNKKILLLSQTTFSLQEFNKIKDLLSDRYPCLVVHNTICPATKERQDSLLKLCSEVEGIIVVGGKNSANTKRLYQSALENCKNAVLIESPEEIPVNFYNLSSVGITAGASTPDEIIENVTNCLINE